MRNSLSNIYLKYPAILIVIPFIFGILCSYYFINPFQTNAIVIVLIQILLILLLIYLFVKIKDIYLKYILIFIVTFVFGFVRFNYVYVSSDKFNIAGKVNDLKDKNIKLYGYLIEQPDENENRLRLIINSDSIVTFNGTIPVDGKVIISVFKNKYSENKVGKYEYGDYIEVSGNLEALPHRRNPGEFDYGEYLKLHDINAAFTSFGYDKIKTIGKTTPDFLKKFIIYPVKKYSVQKIDELMDGDEGDFMKGLILGERSNLSKEIKENFVNDGVSHILAISGIKVAFVLIIISLFLQLFPLSNNIRVIIIILALLFYMDLTGNSPAAVRATIMAIVYLLSTLFERKSIPINILSVAAIIILVFDSRQLFDAGFIISFWTILSLIFMYSKLEKFIKNLKFYSKINDDNLLHKSYKALILLSIMTMIIQVGTIPITALMFKKVSLVSFFTNMVAIPVSNLAMAIGFIFIILSLISNWIASAIAVSSSFLLNLLLKFISFFASLSFSSVETYNLDMLFLICFYLVIIVCLFIPRIKIIPRIFISVLIILNYLILNSINSKSTKLNLTYLDVGNSSSCFISTPNNYNVLINTGTSTKNYSSAENNVIPFLKFRGKDYLDLLIVTNLDKNEARNFIKFVTSFKINRILIPEAYKFIFDDSFLKEKMLCQNVYFINDSKKLDETGELRIFVIPVNRINENLVVKINYGDEKYIFTDFKDNEVNYKNLIENNETEILKVPSSGSFNLIPPEIITGLNPKRIVISAERENKKLNSDVFTASLEKYGFDVYKTSQNGALIFESDGKRTDLVSW